MIRSIISPMARHVMTAALLLTLAGCGGSPPPPVLKLTIAGSAEQNPDPTGRASPVAVRVYQLTGTGKFNQADVFALKDNEAKTLAGEEAGGSEQFLIAPGDTKTVTINLKPSVASIGIAVMYRDIDRAKWRATEAARPSGTTTVSATIGKLALTMKGG